MPRESWLAIRADVRRSFSEILRVYGFSLLDQVEEANAANPWSVAWRQKAPEGTVPFYAFFDGGWTLLYDPWFILWEEQTVHARLSSRFGAPVVVLLSRLRDESMGYGWYEDGIRRRWLFKTGNIVTQNIGTADEWELRGGFEADPGAAARAAWGIHLENSPFIYCLFGSLPGHRPRRRMLQWLPWARRHEKRTPIW